tara:strand:+ start:500 stop:2326 length:1827 start_codon:yes stop_codon:yes gene_type:complete
MVKIPTFTAEGRITAEAPSVQTNVQIPLSNTIGTALSSVTKGIQDYYIKEKKLEADNKAALILNGLYADQVDKEGNVVQKGLLTINSEIQESSSPSDAAKLFDDGVNSLWNYAQTNVIPNQNVDRFTSKALEKKFYATSGLLKNKTIQSTRTNLIKDTLKIDEDTLNKETQMLITVGESYFETFKQKNFARIDANTSIDEGVKSRRKEAFIEFGLKSFGTSLATNDPDKYKALREKGFFDDVNLEDLVKIDKVADGTKLDLNKEFFTTSLNIGETTTQLDLSKAFDNIKEGKFLDIEKQKAWDALPIVQKNEIIKFARTKRSLNTSEINVRNKNLLNKSGDKIKSNYYNMTEKNSWDTISATTITTSFGSPENQFEADEQNKLISIATQIGQGERKNIQNAIMNINIQDFIAQGKITNLSQKFKLPGETKELSIIDRTENNNLTTDELNFYGIIFQNDDNRVFMKELPKIVNIIKRHSAYIKGGQIVDMFDPTLDNRLNKFAEDVYRHYFLYRNKYPEGNDIFEINSPAYLGRLSEDYMPNKAEIQANIIKKSGEFSDENLTWSDSGAKTFEEWDLKNQEYKKKKKQNETFEKIKEKTKDGVEYIPFG